MPPTALVIGRHRPDGPFIVNGLRERGYAVTILHTGHHEVPEIPDDVIHIHVDPYDADALAARWPSGPSTSASRPTAA